MVDNSFVDVLRVWLGAVFVAAGALKLIGPEGLRMYLARQFTLRDRPLKWLASAIASGEAGMGALFLFGIAPATMATVAATALITFSIVLIRGARRGKGGCACFGAVDSGRSNVWIPLTRNGLLIAAALVVAGSNWPATAPAGDDLRRVSVDPTSLLAGLFLLIVSAAVYVVAVQLATPVRSPGR